MGRHCDNLRKAARVASTLVHLFAYQAIVYQRPKVTKSVRKLPNTLLGQPKFLRRRGDGTFFLAVETMTSNKKTA
uniref:Uncharacterized protein n=1 Tax=Anaerolinea thermolimosa TaxID=229919 RepID=A0A7C4KHF0_9CHLR